MAGWVKTPQVPDPIADPNSGDVFRFFTLPVFEFWIAELLLELRTTALTLWGKWNFIGGPVCIRKEINWMEKTFGIALDGKRLLFSSGSGFFS